jgi:lipopolysaccharide transport protein LptA
MKRFLYTLALIGIGGAVQAADVSTTSAGATSTNEPTVITSDVMHGDYVSNYGTFEGNVVVVDPHGTLRADKMVVFFGGTNNIVDGVTNTVRSIQRIVATGGVVILTPDKKKATCEHAVYTTADSKAVLTINPRVDSPDGIVTGKKITFWRDSQRMDVESDTTTTNRSNLLIYPDDQRKKNQE